MIVVAVVVTAAPESPIIATVATGGVMCRRVALAAGPYVPLRTREGSKVKQGGEARACGRTYQPPLQAEASRRRSTPPCASPVIVSSGAVLCGSCQPLAVDSIVRWTSTRPMVFGEEAVPRNACTASASGAAATVASRVGRRSF